MNGWLGEVDGLTVSLHAATAKLTDLDRTIARARGGGPAASGCPSCGRDDDRSSQYVDPVGRSARTAAAMPCSRQA
jgi:hypothetical protein